MSPDPLFFTGLAKLIINGASQIHVRDDNAVKTHARKLSWVYQVQSPAVDCVASVLLGLLVDS